MCATLCDEENGETGISDTHTHITCPQPPIHISCIHVPQSMCLFRLCIRKSLCLLHSTLLCTGSLGQCCGNIVIGYISIPKLIPPLPMSRAGGGGPLRFGRPQAPRRRWWPIAVRSAPGPTLGSRQLPRNNKIGVIMTINHISNIMKMNFICFGMPKHPLYIFFE